MRRRFGRSGAPPPDVPRETENDPTEILRKLTLAIIPPSSLVSERIAGAHVSFRARPTRWQDAVALRVAGIRGGVVSIDLESDHGAVLDVPFGDDVRCWKFRTA